MLIDEIKGVGAIVPINDDLVQTSSITRDEASEVLKEADSLKDKVETAYYDLGIKLLKIKKEQLWKLCDYSSFDRYVTDRLGFKTRKAAYIISNSKKVHELGIDKKDAEEIGWSKLKEVARLDNKSEAVDMVEKAKNLSVKELKELISDNKLPKVTIEDRELNDSPEEQHKKFFSLFTPQLKLVDSAIDHVIGSGDTEKEGQALSIICQTFLANSDGVSDLIVSNNMKEAASAFSEKFNVKLVVMAEDGVVLGAEHLSDD